MLGCNTKRSACILVIALGPVLSCVDAPEDDHGSLHNLPPISWRGEYVEFGTDVETEICPQTISSLDEYMEAVSETVRSNTTYPIQYYYLREDLDSYGFSCGGDALGCVNRVDGVKAIGSGRPSHRHELIHASSSLRHRVLEEGLAVYLGTDLQWAGIADPLDIRAAFESVDSNNEFLPEELYPVVGHFVSFLTDKYGLQRTVSLVEASEPGMTLAELVELSVEHLGRDLRLDIDEYEVSGPGCEVAQFSPTWYECELVPPSIPIFTCDADGDPVPIDISLSCDDGATGVQEGEIWKDILVDAPTRVLTLIHLDEGHPVEFIVRSCGQGCSTPFSRVSSESTEPGLLLDAFYLEAGLNLIRIVKPVEAQGRVRFTIGMSCF